MPDFESGVKGFVIGKATVINVFPIDFKDRADISCYQCRYFRRSSSSCALNGEICQYPEKYVGVNCPLEIGEG